MDIDCLELLPYVCTVLADPEQALPDDTCLEKLLDWLTELTGQVPVVSLLELSPCLIGFVSGACTSGSAEPKVRAFALKLTGLLASSAQAFCHLKQQGILKGAFDYHEWAESSLWQDPTVRSGWVHGLQNMLQHWQAMCFVLENGLVKDILCLQLDRSLFVASAANRLLAAILTFPKLWDGCLSQEEGCARGQKEEGEVCHGLESPLWADGIAQIATHVGDTLMSGVPFHTSQALRLVALSLAQSLPHVRDVLWQTTVGAVQSFKGNVQSSSLQPFLDMLQVATRTHLLSQDNSSVIALVEDMLCTLTPKLAIPFATGLIKLEHCPQDLKERAIAVVLQPLVRVHASVSPQCDSIDPAEESGGQHVAWGEGLFQNSHCVSILCLSLTSTAELLGLELVCEDISVTLVVQSVINILSVSAGRSFPTSATSPCSKVLTKLIGCSRIQKSALDTLSILSQCPGSNECVDDVVNIILLYLQNPDSEPTVFKKTLQAGLIWLRTFSQSSTLFRQQEMFPVLKKRLCDVRWEIRDSSLEFLSQLTSHFQDDTTYREDLLNNKILDFLTALLTDPEAYVRASAVSALSQTAHLISPDTTPVQEDLATRFVDMLSRDTEGFVRRAVMKVFSFWLGRPRPHLWETLEGHLCVVLRLGREDMDWEVKVHTLELVQVLIDRALGASGQSPCPYVRAIPAASPVRAEVREALQRLHECGVFDVLFCGLLDCDRPVAQNACGILLRLKELVAENTDALGGAVTFDLLVCSWGQELLRTHFGKRSVGGDSAARVNIGELLSHIGLEDMQQALGQSSDHLENSPRSLMKDILAAANTAEDNAVDCY